jgi:hypothetical protein
MKAYDEEEHIKKKKHRRSKHRKRRGKRSRHRHRPKNEIVDIEESPPDNSINTQHQIRTVSHTSNDTVSEHLPIVDELVDIEVIDPGAFNQVFIQQRQKAINNTSYRSIIESWKSYSLQELAEIIQIFAKGKSLVDRHWIIFYWIAINIEYDTVSYFTKDYKDQSAEGVFRTRKGVCAGYANLYKYLCEKLHMLCEIVNGYAKGYGFDDRESAPSETDHAWNAVQIYHHWYLMESTWAAGHIDDRKEFKHELASYYFLPRPNEMIYHHFPEDEKWQLLRKPVKLGQFMQMPQLRPDYFEFNLELIQPRNQYFIKLEQDKPFALVIMKAPSDVHLIADLKLHDEKIDGGHRVIFNRKKRQYYCYFAPSNIGRHKVTIYAKRDGTSVGTFRSVLDLVLNIDQMPKNPISYPQTWKCFFDFRLIILSPLRTHLINLNNRQQFAQIIIRTPSNIELIGQLKNHNHETIICATRVYYDRQKDFWRCKFAPNENGIFDAIILAKKKTDPGKYTAAVSFKIHANHVSSSPLSFPDTWQLFYDLDLRILYPVGRGIIILRDKSSFAEIRVKAPNDVALLGQLIDSNKERIPDADQVYYDRHKDIWRCKFAPNHNGRFDATILAKKKSEPGLYSTAVTFQIEANHIHTPPLTFPQTWQAFYDFDLKIAAPRSSSSVIWSENASYAEILIQAPDDIQLSCRIEYNNVQIVNGSLAQYNHENQLWQLLFAPERTGLHELIIYAKRINDIESPSSAVIKFNLDVPILRKPMKFPMIYTQFETTKCRIYTPLNGILKKGSIILIHCVIPGATSTQLTIDSKRLPSEGYKNPILQREITVGSEDVTIYAKYDENLHYTGLIKYSVE